MNQDARAILECSQGMFDVDLVRNSIVTALRSLCHGTCR